MKVLYIYPFIETLVNLDLINLSTSYKYLYYISSSSCFKARCKICEKLSCFSSAL